MTALRVTNRGTFAEEFGDDDLPWLPARPAEPPVADVIAIERPKLADVLHGLSKVMPLFDADDMAELTEEVAAVLEDGSLRAAVQLLDAWRITGERLRDSNAREVLLGEVTISDFVDARPFDA